MNRKMETVALGLVKKMVAKEVRQIPEWPPACVGLLHQPKRPVQEMNK